MFVKFIYFCDVMKGNLVKGLLLYIYFTFIFMFFLNNNIAILFAAQKTHDTEKEVEKILPLDIKKPKRSMSCYHVILFLYFSLLVASVCANSVLVMVFLKLRTLFAFIL